jgi:U3 small nucleolar RNA-associated protein 12
MRTTLIPLRKHLRDALQRQKKAMGYNLAALQFIRRHNEASRVTQFSDEQLDESKVRARLADGKKRKRITLTA